MKTIYDAICTITVTKKGESVIITTSKGLRWVLKVSSPEIAITNVLAHRVAAFYANQERFDDKFMITLNIQRLNDE